MNQFSILKISKIQSDSRRVMNAYIFIELYGTFECGLGTRLSRPILAKLIWVAFVCQRGSLLTCEIVKVPHSI